MNIAWTGVEEAKQYAMNVNFEREISLLKLYNN